jgi:Holliday junction resolvase-like predicted endonuclease
MTRLEPRQRGDIGELSAIEWLESKGADIYLPVGHSPNIDLIAMINGHILRIEVKTSTCSNHAGRWQVMIATRGGNQIWTGLVKRFKAERCDFLFIHVGDGRRWFIPSRVVEGNTGLSLGGPKYADFEIEAGRPLEAPGQDPRLESTERRGSTEAVKRGAL